MPKPIFSEDMLKQVSEAVKAAEDQTSGEIVPVFSQQSSGYEVAYWRGGFLAAVVCGLIFTLLNIFTDWILFYPAWSWLLSCLAAGMSGAMLVHLIAPLRRLFTGKAYMNVRVIRKAHELFHRFEVHQTEMRTGILLYISFFERQAVLLADSGINEFVEPEKWKEIINNLTSRLKKKESLEAVLDTIKEIEKVYLDAGFVAVTGADDGNQLPDEVQIVGEDD